MADHMPAKGQHSDKRAKAGGSTGEERREAATGRRIEAMSHPLRARILRMLVERGVMSPAQLSRELKAELSDVSYHVRRLDVLECAELVNTQPVRGALEHFYRATERHLIDTDEWEALDPITAEDLICGYIQRILDDFVASRRAGIVGYDKHFHITRTPIWLDDEGFQEGMEVFERARLEMIEVERRSAARRADSGEKGVATSSSIVYFKIPNEMLET